MWGPGFSFLGGGDVQEGGHEADLGFPKAKVASSILAGGAIAKTAKNNENTGRFRRFAWCGTAVAGSRYGTDCDAVGLGETRGVAMAWKRVWCVCTGRSCGGRQSSRGSSEVQLPAPFVPMYHEL